MSLRAQIFTKKVSEQTGLSYRVGQAVPHATYVQNAQPWQKLPQTTRERDTAEVSLSERVQKCTVRQKLPYRHRERRTRQKCLSPKKKCAEVHDLAEVALEMRKKRNVAFFATVRACAEVHLSCSKCRADT